MAVAGGTLPPAPPCGAGALRTAQPSMDTSFVKIAGIAVKHPKSRNLCESQRVAEGELLGRAVSPALVLAPAPPRPLAGRLPRSCEQIKRLEKRRGWDGWFAGFEGVLSLPPAPPPPPLPLEGNPLDPQPWNFATQCTGLTPLVNRGLDPCAGRPALRYCRHADALPPPNPKKNPEPGQPPLPTRLAASGSGPQGRPGVSNAHVPSAITAPPAATAQLGRCTSQTLAASSNLPLAVCGARLPGQMGNRVHHAGCSSHRGCQCCWCCGGWAIGQQ